MALTTTILLKQIKNSIVAFRNKMKLSFCCCQTTTISLSEYSLQQLDDFKSVKA